MFKGEDNTCKNVMSTNDHLEMSCTENVTLTERPSRSSKLKIRSNSAEKNYEIHPEITLEQIQNPGANIYHNKRQVQKKLLLMEKENGQISSSVLTTSEMIDSCRKWEIEDKQGNGNAESEIPSDLLDLHTMYNFEPGSHCLIRTSSKKVRQRRNSAIACSVGSKIGIRSKKVADGTEAIENRRRLSIGTMTCPIRKEERRHQKPLYERLTMIESVDNEGETRQCSI